MSLSDKVISNMWVFELLQVPLHIQWSYFCLIYLTGQWVCWREKFIICTSSSKPYLWGGWGLQYRKWRAFFKVVEKILWICFWCFKWACLTFKWCIEQSGFSSLWWTMCLNGTLAGLWLYADQDNSRIWGGKSLLLAVIIS